METVVFHTVSIEVQIEIGVRAPADLFSRAQTEEFRHSLYDLDDDEAVLEHWAYNAAANGVQDISRLDGWADIDKGIVIMRVVGLG